MKSCIYCGERLEDDDLFCTCCGQRQPVTAEMKERQGQEAVAKQAVQSSIVDAMAKVAVQKVAKHEAIGDIAAIIAKMAAGTADMSECSYC